MKQTESAPAGGKTGGDGAGDVLAQLAFDRTHADYAAAKSAPSTMPFRSPLQASSVPTPGR